MAVGLVAAARAPAASAPEPLNAPSPLMKPGASAAGAGTLALTAAQRAQEMGMVSLAASLYRDLRMQPGADKTALTLALASALLDGGRADEAEKVLAEIPEPRSSAWHLRAGLAAMQLKKVESARAALQAIKEPELPVIEHPWYWLLQGAFVDMTAPREEARSNDFYNRAENAAPNELARARFQLAAEEVRIRRGLPARPEDLQLTRQNYERHQGTFIGYSFARDYALMLLLREQRAEAMTFLQMVIPGVPVAETRWWDDLRLTLGVIGERGRSFAGRKALSELLESGHDSKRQRQALQLLWEASQTEPARAQFRATLDRLIAAPAKHPIKESLLYYRASLALVEKNHEQASASANTLLTEFPGSSLRLHAFGLLTQLAWEQRRYRLAADNARKARAEMTALTQPELVAARAELGVLEAEAYFRAGDFRNAADAYAGMLREPPANVKPGDLMYQRVLAEIKSGSADATKVLDELGANPEFDLENRWQAEWSLARALLVQGRTAEAFTRVNRLVESPGAGGKIPADLRARLTWLRTRLSLEARQSEQTLALVDALLTSLADVDEPLRNEIASTALLLKARAQFEMQRERDALATLTKARADFPKSEAAIQSYLIEADYYADQGNIGEAKKRLTTLTDNTDYRTSGFIPYAYYQLALLSERLGQRKDLEDANSYIETLVEFVAKNRDVANLDELLFVARMKQGEILRRLNEFARAQRVYDDLKTKPASPENTILARLALARTHNAQATTDVAHAEQAQLLFEELRDRVDASDDIKVEAGHALGALLASRGKTDHAAKVWWSDVVVPYLLEDKKPFERGAKRPYWLARTLLELGALYEQQGKPEDARNAYDLIRRKALGDGEDSARAALERLGGRPAKS